jgi:hypothetical protein
MKRLIFTLVIIAATITSVFADNRSAKANNENVMIAGRNVLATRTVELENSIKSNNNIPLAQSNADVVLQLMRTGMAQKNVQLNLESRDKQAEINKQYLEMERLTHEYQALSQNVAANGPQLVKNAQAFLKEY